MKLYMPGRILLHLRTGASGAQAEIAATLGLSRSASQDAIRRLVDAQLVSATPVRIPATRNKPPITVNRYSAAPAFGMWPSWLGDPPEGMGPAAGHGPIVACALANSPASVWHAGQRAAA